MIVLAVLDVVASPPLVHRGNFCPERILAPLFALHTGHSRLLPLGHNLITNLQDLIFLVVTLASGAPRLVLGLVLGLNDLVLVPFHHLLQPVPYLLEEVACAPLVQMLKDGLLDLLISALPKQQSNHQVHAFLNDHLVHAVSDNVKTQNRSAAIIKRVLHGTCGFILLLFAVVVPLVYSHLSCIRSLSLLQTLRPLLFNHSP
mmetsp:Transcript_9305/g.18869  ORF Transcript_9305/g.18869 Transcript_9305/m.18869 type:complete len:202 (-) Transcript_9305:5994-6599(-)